MNYADINWQKCQNEVLKLQRKIIVAWNNNDKISVYKIQEILIPGVPPSVVPRE